MEVGNQKFARLVPGVASFSRLNAREMSVVGGKDERVRQDRQRTPLNVADSSAAAR